MESSRPRSDPPDQSFPAVSVSQADLDARPSLVSSRDQSPAGI